ncbi:hypothetical protein M408DRAFT_68821 [Serendipita vermifera MAFF 305830]|uniref:Uncharacterized protein n=1 Tax=Serendipita vermifera MAFF 305830 TaxID=933852 RepID=A0A0C3BBH8_SERVB|nr:hypothetical protein M408DRAFT_68821 [Serendipita vermifera MAFF 305830]
MAPKRKAEAEEVVETREARPSRAAKVAKTSTDDKATKPKATKAKSKKEARISFIYSSFFSCFPPLPSKEEFKASALPLHVNITHTPPPIDQVSAASQTPGFMGHIVLTPTEFNTRSYGWKGSKKLYVELQNSEGPDKKKVWVQLNINATVVGSKPDDEEGEQKEEEKPVPVEGQ